jgi:hypothetical protein
MKEILREPVMAAVKSLLPIENMEACTPVPADGKYRQT